MDHKIDEEEAAIITKLFNCTESVIKEWIAEYLDKSPSDVFDDYVDDPDVIGFQENNKHYNAYVVTMKNTTSLVDSKLLKNSEKARKACSMLFDGVYKVFSSVIQTSTEYKEQIQGLRPVFDESSMSFQLKCINVKAEQLKIAVDQLHKTRAYLCSSKTELINDQLESIKNSIKLYSDIIKSNTTEVLNAAEEECKKTNERLATLNNLCIAIEDVDDQDIDNLETSMRRLPTFGLQYQDPDEENYIDKLKKEYSVE